jgi:cell division protein FtsN
MLISLLMAAPMAVQAQKILICKDAAGRTLTSDRPIPECADRAVKEMDRNGVVRREIPAPLTAEQKRQKQEEEEKRKTEEAAAAEQRQADRALLARYRNENEIEIAHQRTAAIIQEQIKRESASLAAAEKRRNAAQAELAQAKDGKALAIASAHKLQESDQSIADIKKKTREYEDQLAEIDGKFAATLKRYRELTTTTAAK